MLLGNRHTQAMTLTSTGLSPSTAPLSNGLRPHSCFLTARDVNSRLTTRPTTPRPQPLSGITRPRFSLIRFRSPLLSESLLFSLPAGTEMFHFPTFPPHTLYIQVQVTGHNSNQVSPFGHPRINARLPTPQGLSQAPTSFIGSRCQGIHHVPFAACQHKHSTKQTKKHYIHSQHPTPNVRGDARVHYPDLKHHEDTPPPTPIQGPAGNELHQDTQNVMPQNPNSVPCTTPEKTRDRTSRRPLVSTTMRGPDTRRPTGVRAP